MLQAEMNAQKVQSLMNSHVHALSLTLKSVMLIAQNIYLLLHFRILWKRVNVSLQTTST